MKDHILIFTLQNILMQLQRVPYVWTKGHITARTTDAITVSRARKERRINDQSRSIVRGSAPRAARRFMITPASELMACP